jgi:hypothetical protein
LDGSTGKKAGDLPPWWGSGCGVKEAASAFGHRTDRDFRQSSGRLNVGNGLGRSNSLGVDAGLVGVRRSGFGKGWTYKGACDEKHDEFFHWISPYETGTAGPRSLHRVDLYYLGKVKVGSGKRETIE